MTNKEKSDALDTIHYFLNDPNKLSDVQKKSIKNYFNNTATGTSEQNSGGFFKRAARTFLTNFQPDTFNNSYVNRAYIDAGIDPTIVNTLLKNPSAIDTMKIPDYEKKYLRNLLNIPLNLNTDSINLAKNMHTSGDPTSFVKNAYAEYLKSNNKSDMLKLSDNNNNNTGSGNIGVFDASDNNHTPITPNNPMLPHTPIGTDTPKNTIGNSVTKKINQKKELPQNLLPVNLGEYNEDTSSAANKQPVLTPEQIAYEKAKNATNSLESSAIIGDYYTNHGAKKSVDNPKTALTEPQRDYYRYLTGYQRMAPNQAILSMGLDPNKYYY